MNRTGRWRNERGLGMIWALLLVLVFSAFSLSIVQRGRDLRLRSETDRARLAAYQAAQGGLEYARHELSHNAAFRGGTVVIGTCEVRVAVEATGRDWRVEVAARPGGMVLEARLARESGSLLPVVTEWRRR